MMVFKIENEDQSKLVQMKLFSMGYNWPMCVDKKCSYLSSPVLVVRGETIFFNNNMESKYLDHIIDVNSFLGIIPEDMFTL